MKSIDGADTPNDEYLEFVEAICRLTDLFCAEYLDEALRDRCRKLVLRLSRNPSNLLLSRTGSIWACVVIRVIAEANCLTEPSSKPRITTKIIEDFFQTRCRDIAAIAKDVRRTLKISKHDRQFAVPERLEASGTYQLEKCAKLVSMMAQQLMKNQNQSAE